MAYVDVTVASTKAVFTARFLERIGNPIHRFGIDQLPGPKRANASALFFGRQPSVIDTGDFGALQRPLCARWKKCSVSRAPQEGSMGLAKAKSDLEAVRREIAQLEAKLRNAKDREVKISHYIEMSELYGGERATDSLGSETSQRQRRTSSATSNVNDAVTACINYLREVKHPVKTKDLLKMLQDRGIDVGGQNPVTNLSAMLSRSEGLQADRTVGWSLCEASQKDDEEPIELESEKIESDFWT